jgi:hypothetical protein
MDFYSFDTSAILNGRRDLLPAVTFPTLWENIEEMIRSGAVRSVDTVLEELVRRDDDASAWAKRNVDLFLPLEVPVQRATSEILRRYPRLTGKGGQRNAADPFVIGLAAYRGGTVVTEEKPTGRLEKPHIPDVCHALGIPCLTLVGFVVEQEWTF